MTGAREPSEDTVKRATFARVRREVDGPAVLLHGDRDTSPITTWPTSPRVIAAFFSRMQQGFSSLRPSGVATLIQLSPLSSIAVPVPQCLDGQWRQRRHQGARVGRGFGRVQPRSRRADAGRNIQRRGIVGDDAQMRPRRQPDRHRDRGGQHDVDQSTCTCSTTAASAAYTSGGQARRLDGRNARRGHHRRGVGRADANSCAAAPGQRRGRRDGSNPPIRATARPGQAFSGDRRHPPRVSPAASRALRNLAPQPRLPSGRPWPRSPATWNSPASSLTRIPGRHGPLLRKLRADALNITSSCNGVAEFLFDL